MCLFYSATKSQTAEEFIRGKILSSSTITGEQNPSDDDDDDDDSDSTTPGGGGERGGPFLIRRRGMQRRQDQLHHQSQLKIDIAMVINLDLSNIDVRHYTARLNYTKKVIVSLFDPSARLVNNINNNDTTTTISTTPVLSAKDLVDVLRTYRQKIPGELLTLSPPPPLMSPNHRLRVRRHRVVGDALGVMGGGDVEGERGNSEHEREEGEGDAEDDVDFEDVGRIRSTVRRQEYLHVRNTIIRSHSSSASGDDDDDNGSERSSLLKSSSSTSSRVSLSSHPHFPSSPQHVRPNPVRRLRHAEVVLVDQCLSAYGRTWLRLRWPGEFGGFAGFVAIGGGRARPDVSDSRSKITPPLAPGEQDKKKNAVLRTDKIGSVSRAPTAETALPFQTSSLCQETNEYYPTSSAMKLLPLYDDGLGANQIGEDEAALLGLVMDNGEVRFDWRFYLQLRRRDFYRLIDLSSSSFCFSPCFVESAEKDCTTSIMGWRRQHRPLLRHRSQKFQKVEEKM